MFLNEKSHFHTCKASCMKRVNEGGGRRLYTYAYIYIHISFNNGPFQRPSV